LAKSGPWQQNFHFLRGPGTLLQRLGWLMTRIPTANTDRDEFLPEARKGQTRDRNTVSFQGCPCLVWATALSKTHKPATCFV
jgi:hypothetical protein